jgi:uncharacterized membrane protein
VNRSIESALRFVNLTASGLLAGSLGFGEAALVPGWQNELPRETPRAIDNARILGYFNAIGPVALGTAITLAIAGRDRGPARRVLDATTAVGLAGVLATTIMVTVPINRQIEEAPAVDYASDQSQSLVKNWGRAHAIRTSLGVGAFICAVVSAVSKK